MTRKDYRLIATAIREAKDMDEPYGPWAVHNAAARISKALKTENPRFNEVMFMKAAVGEDE